MQNSSSTHRRKKQAFGVQAQQLLDPKTLKKRSQIEKRTTKEIFVKGVRERTTTGYKISGYTGKGFEIYYEAFLPGSASDTFVHPGKDRVVRGLSGQGFLSVTKDGVSAQRAINPGDEVVLPAGSTYRISTTGTKEVLEVLIIQDSKYTARLQTVAAGEAVTVSDEVLAQREPTMLQQVRRGSKAREQQLMTAKPKGAVPGSSLAEFAKAAAMATEGVNVVPSGGNFSSEGAG
jgi:mannose-6-phosphate isomerase-like protein (cupin superfamily)